MGQTRYFQNSSVLNVYGQLPTREQWFTNRPAVFSICDLTYQACCYSTLCWPCEHTMPTPTKTKAGRSSLMLLCSGSATTWKASSSCCGGHTLRRKELLLTGWVYTALLIHFPQNILIMFTYLKFSHSVYRNATMSCRLCIHLPYLPIADSLVASISQKPMSCWRNLESLP